MFYIKEKMSLCPTDSRMVKDLTDSDILDIRQGLEFLSLFDYMEISREPERLNGKKTIRGRVSFNEYFLTYARGEYKTIEEARKFVSDFFGGSLIAEDDFHYNKDSEAYKRKSIDN